MGFNRIGLCFSLAEAFLCFPLMSTATKLRSCRSTCAPLGLPERRFRAQRKGRVGKAYHRHRVMQKAENMRSKTVLNEKLMTYVSTPMW
ncbi:hypothetical protein F4604DRAFT_1754895 [Suillus subluteus]|nr:hypothetical protein F4604DRAFT_1754895 [Suillus subluteus]